MGNMNKFNIFQGDERILRVVCRTLGYEESAQNLTFDWFTEDIYLSTFFYLTKRFGEGDVYDSYKDAGVWSFEVKYYTIQIYLSSKSVKFMMFGRFGNRSVHSPLIVKHLRESSKKSELLVGLFRSKKTEKEASILEEQFELFKNKKGLDENLTKEEFENLYLSDWFDWITAYNDSVINLNYDEITSKYGTVYSNSYTRHALKTLEQFIKNMLTPEWIRDVPYNIKGCISDEQAVFYSRYENNIKINRVDK